MGVDHDCIFAYGFLLRPFDKKSGHTWDRLEKFVDDLNKSYLPNGIGTYRDDTIRFGTDAYYPDEIFVYIYPKGNEGFECGNRGHNTFGVNDNTSITFSITNLQKEALSKVREAFQDYLSQSDSKVGWRAFSYSH